LRDEEIRDTVREMSRLSRRERRLVLEARVHSARVPDQDGIRLLLDPARERLGRLSLLWVDAGYQGRARRWAEEVMA
jgi:hypothetical protein